MVTPQTEILITVAGVERGRHMLAPGEYILGRDAGCHVRIEAELVSPRHAKLTLNSGNAFIEDLGSSNGTQINGEPISGSTLLSPSHKVQIGTATIELRSMAPESSLNTVLIPIGEVAQTASALPEEFLRRRKYEIGGVVARGGMGAILDATEATTGRTVAMKVMLDSKSPDDLQRFLTEAKITARLEHPNIVPVYELSVHENGEVFYTMQFVKGITLRKVLELLADGVEATVKKFPLPTLLTIFQKMCDAVAFAHSKSIIHRDLKPENIMLGDFGSVLVMDWGLAKQTRSADVGTQREEAASSPGGLDLRIPNSELGQTLVGTVMGTPQYMGPEQARGEVDTLDQRADIYSLGAILYHILARRPAVTGETATEVVTKVGRGEVGRLPNAGHPDSLVAVVHKAMAFDRSQRYANVADLQADIAAYQGGFATSAERAGLGRQLFLAVMRHKVTTAAVAITLLSGIGFGTKAILEGRRAEREAVRAKAEAKRAEDALTDLKASAPSLLALAESEAGFQRFDSALVKLDAALALDPALTAGWWRRAWLLLGMARYGEAPAAFRTAQQRDPAQHAHDALLPVLDAIAAAPDDATRFPPERTEALFRHFTKVGASGELNALSQRLTLGAKQKEQMVRQRLDEWLGKGVGRIEVQPDGAIWVDSLPKATDALEPLRGLPLGRISISGTAVKSLEPLRGMALTKVAIIDTHFSDLSPLRGMPIAELYSDLSDISDLTPLAGMPLRIFRAPQTKISDISPLRGAPLEEINLLNNRIVDFSPLLGAPLTRVAININQCSDISFLTHSPALEYLSCNNNSITDLSPLRGKPLKFLNAGSNRITDIRPLAGLPLTELMIHYNPIADYAPLRELRQLQKLRISVLKDINVTLDPLRQHPSLQYIALGDGGPYRPVAEFWADYDAQQAAQKK